MTNLFCICVLFFLLRLSEISNLIFSSCVPRAGRDFGIAIYLCPICRLNRLFIFIDIFIDLIRKIFACNKNILYICKSCNQKKNSYESNTCKQILKVEKVGSTFYSKYQTEVRDQEVKNPGTE